MDDQKFDDIIRSKLIDYEDNAFDPGSLAALRHQMADAAGIGPWYTRYHRQLVTIATVVFCMFLLLGVQWYWNRRHAQLWTAELVTLRTLIGENAIMRDELSRLKNLPSDTVRIIETRDAGFQEYRSLLRQYHLLENEVQDLRNHLVTLHGSMESLDLLNSRSLPTRSRVRSDQHTGPSPVEQIAGTNPSIVPDAIAKEKWYPQRRIPAAMTRDLEKHYQKGIGIKVGPALDLSKGDYSSGQGQFAVGYGIASDFILSPSISVEVGVKYFKRYYEISDRDELASVNLPDATGSTGMLLKAEVDNWMLEVPIAIKYRYLLSSRMHGLAGAGYSTNIFMNQVFEYDYQFNNGSNGDFIVHSLYRHKATSVYPGILNFSIGLSNRLKNGKSLEAAIVYQQGLGAIGIENNKARYLGVRTVYWFTLR